jgi:hypothetical protein
MVHNYSCDPSMSNNFNPLTTIFLNKTFYTHRIICLTITSKIVDIVYYIGTQNLQVWTYGFEPNNHHHKLWHIEKHFGVEQLSNFP